MNVSFDKSSDTMSLYLTYDAAKPTDCDEAVRLAEAFRKATEPKPMDPQTASMWATLIKGVFGPGFYIQTAIKATSGDTPYDRAFRNALRYAQYLVNGTVPQYEGPTLGNEHSDTATAPECTKIKDEESYRLGYMEAIDKINEYILRMGEAAHTD